MNLTETSPQTLEHCQSYAVGDLNSDGLFDLVLRHVKEPQTETGPFRMLGTILESNPYLGRIVTGRIRSGSIKPNQDVKVLDRDGIGLARIDFHDRLLPLGLSFEFRVARLGSPAVADDSGDALHHHAAAG